MFDEKKKRLFVRGCKWNYLYQYTLLKSLDIKSHISFCQNSQLTAKPRSNLSMSIMMRTKVTLKNLSLVARQSKPLHNQVIYLDGKCTDGKRLIKMQMFDVCFVNRETFLLHC